MAMLTLRVIETSKQVPIENALVYIDEEFKNVTTEDGKFMIDLEEPKNEEPKNYEVEIKAFGINYPKTVTQQDLEKGGDVLIEVDLTLPDLQLKDENYDENLKYATDGQVVGLMVDKDKIPKDTKFEMRVSAGRLITLEKEIDETKKAQWEVLNATGKQRVYATLRETQPNASELTFSSEFHVREAPASQKPGPVPIRLDRSAIPQTRDQALWVYIRNRAASTDFNSYEDFINAVLCEVTETPELDEEKKAKIERLKQEIYQPVYGSGAYELLITATQVFLLLECGFSIVDSPSFSDRNYFDPDDESSRLGRRMTLDEISDELQNYLGGNRLPYINRIINKAFKGRRPSENVFCDGYLASRAKCPPLIELIWSYWHEEGMLAQTMNVISRRFQNRRSGNGRDPLAHLEIAPLYPLNNLMWGYIQNEHNRISVLRRAHEYSHHYGLNLYGKAISDFRPADNRSKFLEGFHNLLYLTTRFFQQADDTTVIPDGFPILNALREVHQVLAEGAHNQFGDLPWASRAEMLVEQWMLARPEMREFLQSRAMVPYREDWMPQVDTMKNLQGWTDTSVSHFNFLATYGEQLLLSIRYGDWINVTNPANAANWVSYWRPEIQGYIHAYRAATGVDLADSRQSDRRSTLPSKLLSRRLKTGAMAKDSPISSKLPAPGFRERKAVRRRANQR